VIVAVACGTDMLVYRLPSNLHSRVVPSRWMVDIGVEWVAANGWLADLPSREGTARMRDWSRWAYEPAARLGRMGRS
jgi:hypothetical protein